MKPLGKVAVTKAKSHMAPLELAITFGNGQVEHRNVWHSADPEWGAQGKSTEMFNKYGDYIILAEKGHHKVFSMTVEALEKILEYAKQCREVSAGRKKQLEAKVLAEFKKELEE